ncbi:hypothetical protein JDFR1000234_23 [uncultured archaeal virus]|jgi:hypothetical protein|uniref:Uncharacterized protein n=1 Tax=uncultured archaeal virus TaxID=1960247 RepID=A0A1S5Y311_9VIRU|nr:hypothetical protein JDFR1000234_23 [uncultured archaeal virus]
MSIIRAGARVRIELFDENDVSRAVIYSEPDLVNFALNFLFSILKKTVRTLHLVFQELK